MPPGGWPADHSYPDVVSWDVGYYDIPRDGDYEAIAARMGCAPSTAAEHLRKAESKVLRAAFAPE